MPTLRRAVDGWGVGLGGGLVNWLREALGWQCGAKSSVGGESQLCGRCSGAQANSPKSWLLQRPLWSKCSLVECLEPKEGTALRSPVAVSTRPVPGWVGGLMEHGAGRQQDSGHCELRGWGGSWDLGPMVLGEPRNMHIGLPWRYL